MSNAFIRPYVILNVAVTADGKTDTVNRESAAISSEEDMRRVDRLRSEVDAVMVGGRTLEENDPRLIIKSDELQLERAQRALDPNPVKIGVVTRANLRPDSRFLTYGPAKIFIFTSNQTQPSQVEMLEKLGVRVFIMGNQRVDLPELMQRLWQEGIKRILVEGGGTLNQALLSLGYIDEIYIYIAPKIFGGVAAPTFVDGPGFLRDKAIMLNLIGVHQEVGGGILIHYQLCGST